jgi:hypothetical protein
VRTPAHEENRESSWWRIFPAQGKVNTYSGGGTAKVAVLWLSERNRAPEVEVARAPENRRLKKRRATLPRARQAAGIALFYVAADETTYEMMQRYAAAQPASPDYRTQPGQLPRSPLMGAPGKRARIKLTASSRLAEQSAASSTTSFGSIRSSSEANGRCGMY